MADDLLTWWLTPQQVSGVFIFGEKIVGAWAAKSLRTSLVK